MKLPILISECEWLQFTRIKPKDTPDEIEQNYLVPGFKVAGLKIAENIVNAKLKKSYRIRVSIQVVAEEITE
jgi:hypothetical protein